MYCPVSYTHLSHASLQEGEALTVDQLLNVLLIPSANDAAVALAEDVYKRQGMAIVSL